jgi:transcriptional regulator with XRE-family HTH domain
VHPEEVGLIPGARRRVAGLRREELAMLAGISAEYYLRLELGRDKNPSAQVVEALARPRGWTSRPRGICTYWPTPSSAVGIIPFWTRRQRGWTT